MENDLGNIGPEGGENNFDVGAPTPSNSDLERVENPKNEVLDKLDVDTLKGINEKCTGKGYKGGRALFGKDVELSDEETSQVDTLIEASRETFENFTEKEPLWSKFQTILEERRLKVGHLAEESSIIPDESAEDVTKALRAEGVPAIRVPERVHRLYIWNSRIDSVQETLRLYRAGQNKGTSANYFGENIKELYRFLKESTQSQTGGD